jgi:hypothetical protein
LSFLVYINRILKVLKSFVLQGNVIISVGEKW